ncbi:hypothetical protein BC828DRAFT_439949 [Blastocladiella britannica]|nr:hypothetical protein BC828DRAFT_439949 [Blastocladiella britannica]
MFALLRKVLFGAPAAPAEPAAPATMASGSTNNTTANVDNFKEFASLDEEIEADTEQFLRELLPVMGNDPENIYNYNSNRMPSAAAILARGGMKSAHDVLVQQRRIHTGGTHKTPAQMLLSGASGDVILMYGSNYILQSPKLIPVQ